MQIFHLIVSVIIANENQWMISRSSSKTQYLVKINFKRAYGRSECFTRVVDGRGYCFRYFRSVAEKQQGNMKVADWAQSAMQPVDSAKRVSDIGDLLCCVMIWKDSEEQAVSGPRWTCHLEK